MVPEELGCARGRQTMAICQAQLPVCQSGFTGQSCAHVLWIVQRCLHAAVPELNSVTETNWPAKLKYLLSGPWQKKFAYPWTRRQLLSAGEVVVTLQFSSQN